LDRYTEEVKDWLNKRFSSTDDKGVYIAHQPIYGFRNEPSEPGHICRYIITYRLLESLGCLDFDSLLDVGGAEGYKAYLAQQLLGISVLSTDLSEEACRRASEIFGVEARPSDLHDMKFENGQFDVVTCSETLEHVTDWKHATSELLRIARKAVVITIPQDSETLIERNKETKEIHAHIHHFDSDSFDYLKSEGYTVTVQKVSSSLLVIPACLVDAQIRVHNEDWRHPKILTRIYNVLALATKKIFGEKTAAFIIWLDRIFCLIFRFHQTNIVVILKNKESKFQSKSVKKISINDIVNFSVPRHYLINNKRNI